jgi:hypothetical protein
MSERCPEADIELSCVRRRGVSKSTLLWNEGLPALKPWDLSTYHLFGEDQEKS